jgi:hypothetical protein
MKTKMLQEADPTGEGNVHLPNGGTFLVSRS